MQDRIRSLATGFYLKLKQHYLWFILVPIFVVAAILSLAYAYLDEKQEIASSPQAESIQSEQFTKHDQLQPISQSAEPAADDRGTEKSPKKVSPEPKCLHDNTGRFNNCRPKPDRENRHLKKLDKNVVENVKEVTGLAEELLGELNLKLYKPKS